MFYSLGLSHHGGHFLGKGIRFPFLLEIVKRRVDMFYHRTTLEGQVENMSALRLGEQGKLPTMALGVVGGLRTA